jgi:ABC-type phosphate transport system substrate-binding protein
MFNRKFSNRARAVVAAGAMLSGLIGTAVVAPAASATLQFPSFTFSLAAEGAQPTAPRFYEGFSNTINVAGSETAEYALEQVGALYNNAGIFGCNQNSDKRTCASTDILPSTDVYDNFDHDVVSNAQAVGSAAGVQQLCTAGADGYEPSEPSPIPATWPYYEYPTPEQANEGADGIPIDLVRASASEADLTAHGVSVCADLQQQAIAADAVVGIDFRPQGTTAGQLPDGTPVEEVAPATPIDFSNVGGAGSTTDTAYRVFCDPATDPLAITTWDQLYAAENIPNPPSPDQPLVLWGPKNNSGTGATWYTFAGCGTGTGRIPSNHLVTENDAQQVGQYAAQDSSETVQEMNPSTCTGTPVVCGTTNVTIDNCDGSGVGSGLGTSSYGNTPQSPYSSNEQCVAQEVADSLFFMSYGYYFSHPFTAAVAVPTEAQGTSPSYIDLTIGSASGDLYEVGGSASTVGGATVNSTDLGQPGTGGVTGDPRATPGSGVLTGRDLWLDYLVDHVRASTAAFVNWVCDYSDYISPKGADLTTGQPIDNEITSDLGAWGWNRLSCDGGTGAFAGRGSTYTSPITNTTGTYNGVGYTEPVIDPGPPNNE